MLKCPIFDGVSGVRQDFKSAFLASYLRRLPASLPALRSVSEPPQSDAANELYVTFFPLCTAHALIPFACGIKIGAKASA